MATKSEKFSIRVKAIRSSTFGSCERASLMEYTYPKYLSLKVKDKVDKRQANRQRKTNIPLSFNQETWRKLSPSYRLTLCSTLVLLTGGSNKKSFLQCQIHYLITSIFTIRNVVHLNIAFHVKCHEYTNILYNLQQPSIGRLYHGICFCVKLWMATIIFCSNN